MILDVFSYAGERDLLRLRLLTLRDVVDLFVPVESDQTHQGDDRDISRPDLDLEFADFLIQPIIVTDAPRVYTEDTRLQCPHCEHPLGAHGTRHGCEALMSNGYCPCGRNLVPVRGEPGDELYGARQRAQLEAIGGRLAAHRDFDPDSTVFLSDLDEIPDPNHVENIRDAVNSLHEPMALVHDYRFLALDYQHPDQTSFGTVAGKLGELDPLQWRATRETLPASISGWHLSWVGSHADRSRNLHTTSRTELRSYVDPQAHWVAGETFDGQKMEHTDALLPPPIENDEFEPQDEWWSPLPALLDR